VLEELQRRLATSPVAVIVVQGLGGVGKSQVVLEYAYRMRAAGCYQVTGWLRADSPVTIAEDLAALAPQLGLAAAGPAGEVAERVVATLESRSGWLLVFDNAKSSADLAGMLPARGGHVLITSRNRGWSGLATQLNLDVFNRAESVMYLCERSGRDEPDAAEELAAELGDLPLALAQAAAYIDTRAIMIGHYLKLYRDPAIGQRLRAEGLSSEEYPESVARTWLLHFDSLQRDRPATIELLRLCAFLDPDAIDLDLFPAAADKVGATLSAALENPLERTETVGALAGASLVTVLTYGWLRVHRLVQAVTRDQLDSDQAAAWVRRVLSLVGGAFPDNPDDPLSWPMCARLAAHVIAISEYAEHYPDLAVATGYLLNFFGVYLAVSAQPSAARTIYERALAIREAAYGPDHPEVAVSLGNLANVQRQLGEPRAARANYERALAIDKAAYGPDHPEVAKTLTQLGVVQLELGELPAARANQERALAIAEAAYGPGHPEVASILINLGVVQRELSELSAARASFERALAINEAAYGPDHPEVAQALGNLGIIQRELGELPAARASQERTLAIKEAAYGPDHPEVAGTLINLGNVQWEMGDLSAARASHERALAIYEAVYGPDNPEVAKSLANLGSIELRSGELSAARASFERAVTIKEAVYGPDHPEVALTLTNLGITQMQLGNLAAARATLERSLAIKKTAYGANHPQVAISLTNLGAVQLALGEPAAARASYQQALNIFESVYGPDHPNAREIRTALRSNLRRADPAEGV
jgi:Tfp pilus assembly protein PilF